MTVGTKPSKSERTRSAVLAAAEELFSERGFDATPLNLIGERAGIQGSAILYHFPTKGALYEAVLERMFTPMLVELRAVLDGAGPLPDRLGNMSAAMVRFVAAHPGAARLVLREALAGDEARAIVGAASQREWVRFAHALEKEGAFDFDPLVVWNLVIGAISFTFGVGHSVGGLDLDAQDPEQVAEFEARIVHLTHALCDYRRPSGGSTPRWGSARTRSPA